MMPPEWKEREEKRKAEEAMRNTQGITIRRRPATGPPIHNVGPFQFKIQSEGNTPRNILEEIVWHKDVEVAQVSYQFLSCIDCLGYLRKRACGNAIDMI